MGHIPEITSFSNPRFKELKALSKSRNRKKSGHFLMEGRPEVDHAIASGLAIDLVVYTESYISQDEVSKLIGDDSMEQMRLSKALFDDLAYQSVRGNIMLLIRSWDHKLNELNSSETILMLEGIEKPGNLGAILRTADAAGIQNVVVTECAIDLFNPNVLRNSRGGLFTAKVVFCTNDEASQFLAKHKYTSYAAIIGDKSADFRTISTQAKSALIFGAESKGLTNFWHQNASHHVKIPMQGIVDSLNLSVSVGIVLAHLKL